MASAPRPSGFSGVDRKDTMLIGEKRIWLGFNGFHARRRLANVGSAKGKMAVVALVERLDQVKSGGFERCGNLGMGDAGPPDDVNRSAQEMI